MDDFTTTTQSSAPNATSLLLGHWYVACALALLAVTVVAGVVVGFITWRRRRRLAQSADLCSAIRDGGMDSKSLASQTGSMISITSTSSSRSTAPLIHAYRVNSDVTIPERRFSTRSTGIDPAQIRSECYTNDVNDDAAAEAGEETASSDEKLTDHGMLDFSLRYDNGASVLAVTVVKATGLHAANLDSFCPYVKVRLLPDKHHKAKTKIVRRSVNPVFDETFTFAGIDAGRLRKRGTAVHMSVFSADTFSKDTLIAELLFPLDEFDLQNQACVNATRPLSLGFKVTAHFFNNLAIKNEFFG